MKNPVVEISDGKLRGTVLKNLDGEDYYAFLGIPYAKPPIGKLRFKPPEPVDRWEEIKYATTYGEKPLHLEPLVSTDIQGSEDCLHLNVFMKKLPDEMLALKPVLVYFFGGKFRQGSNSPDLFGSNFLLLEDFILVFPNYRVGLLGFLRLEDPALDVTGNVGLKDQAFALQWVQKNIQKFGGDSNNVTICGHSTGASAVHYHLFSPLSRDLFHKAIMLSGTIFWTWSENYAFSLDLLLELLGVKKKSESEILECLQNLPAKEILEAQDKYINMHNGKGLIIGPVIEKPNRTAFLSEDPTNLLLNGEFAKVPLLFTYTTHEALMFDLLDHSLQTISNFSIAPEDIIPQSLKSKMTKSSLENICCDIERVYTTEDVAWKRLMMLSDFYFVAPLFAAAKTHAELTEKPVYLMRWSIDDELNVMKKMCNGDEWPGTSHVDEMGYIFSCDALAWPVKGSTAYRAVKRSIHLLKNFCEYGNPSKCQHDIISKWQPLQIEKNKFVDYGAEITFIDFPERKRMELWQRIFEFDRRNTKLSSLKLV